MAGDERQDHAVERAIGLGEERRGLRRLERTPARDLRDLGHEAGAEEQERLRRLAQGHPGLLRLDAVFASERLGLREVLLAPGAARRVERSEQQVAHAHPALAEPAQRMLVEPRAPVLVGELRAHTLAE